MYSIIFLNSRNDDFWKTFSNLSSLFTENKNSELCSVFKMLVQNIMFKSHWSHFFFRVLTEKQNQFFQRHWSFINIISRGLG